MIEIYHNFIIWNDNSRGIVRVRRWKIAGVTNKKMKFYWWLNQSDIEYVAVESK